MLTLSKILVIVNFTISSVPEDGLKCHPEHHKFEENMDLSKKLLLFRQFKITWNDWIDKGIGVFPQSFAKEWDFMYF